MFDEIWSSSSVDLPELVKNFVQTDFSNISSLRSLEIILKKSTLVRPLEHIVIFLNFTLVFHGIDFLIVLSNMNTLQKFKLSLKWVSIFSYKSPPPPLE